MGLQTVKSGEQLHTHAFPSTSEAVRIASPACENTTVSTPFVCSRSVWTRRETTSAVEYWE